MRKRLLLIIAGIFAVLLIFAVLKIKKALLPLRMKEGRLTSATSLYQKAANLEVRGSLQEARSLYQALANEFSSSNEVAKWQKKIEELNIKLLFSPMITPKSTAYEVRPGDTLAKIAKEFKTTVELIMKSNNLSRDKIMPGKKIKVWNAPFSILVDKSQDILILKSEEEAVKTYIVATGVNNSTPTGNFKIINKLLNPTWFKAGGVVPATSPENILGSRWLGLDLAGYGIHGTTDPKNLGKQVTQGCVRMSNSDVEELYAIIPVGTEVSIID